MSYSIYWDIFLRNNRRDINFHNHLLVQVLQGIIFVDNI